MISGSQIFRQSCIFGMAAGQVSQGGDAKRGGACGGRHTLCREGLPGCGGKGPTGAAEAESCKICRNLELEHFSRLWYGSMISTYLELCKAIQDFPLSPESAMDSAVVAVFIPKRSRMLEPLVSLVNPIPSCILTSYAHTKENDC